MLYYSDKARVSAINSIENLIKKVAVIPGNYLDYTSCHQLINQLNDLIGVIEDERSRVTEEA